MLKRKPRRKIACFVKNLAATQLQSIAEYYRNYYLEELAKEAELTAETLPLQDFWGLLEDSDTQQNGA